MTMGKKKYKVVVVMQLIETLELEVKADSPEDAEYRAIEKAVNTDAKEWYSECTSAEYQTEEV
jgi:hypothetical protein